MVELGNLDLVQCTEVIDLVSISGNYKILTGNSCDIVSMYRKRQRSEKKLSLYQYYQKMKNNGGPLSKEGVTYIPHFVGGDGQPKYPVTSSYARSTILTHMPWDDSRKPTYEGKWIEKFNEFIQSSDCPTSVKVAYARVKERHLKKTTFVEPTASEECYDYESTTGMDEETKDLLSLVSTFTKSMNPEIAIEGFSMNRGINYDWSSRTNKVRKITIVIYHRKHPNVVQISSNNISPQHEILFS